MTAKLNTSFYRLPFSIYIKSLQLVCLARQYLAKANYRSAREGMHHLYFHHSCLQGCNWLRSFSVVVTLQNTLHMPAVHS